MSSTLLSQANVAHNPINPFIKVSSACWDFCPGSALGMLLAVPGPCSFQETPNTYLSSCFLKTRAISVVKNDEGHKPFLRELQYL